MAWLTGYAYRMSAPMANPNAVEDKKFTLKFPAWFLRSQGKIARADYNDVRVTTADGSTTLPCSLNTAKNALTVDYASMPLGRTTLYVYYGNAAADAPASPTTPRYGIGTAGLSSLFDLDSSRSDSAHTAPQTSGSGAWHDLSGAARDTTPTGAVYTSDGSLVFDGSNDYAQTANYASAMTTGYSFAAWCKVTRASADSNQPIIHKAFTSHVAPYYQFMVSLRGGATTADFYKMNIQVVAGGTRYEVNSVNAIFAENTLQHIGVTVSKATGDAKIYVNGVLVETIANIFADNTVLTGYNTPFEFGSYTWLHGSASYHTEMSLYGATVADAVWSDANFATLYSQRIVLSSLTQVIHPNDERTSENDPTSRHYVWGSDLDATYIAADAPTAYYGSAATHKVGVGSAANQKYHYLLRHFEGALPLGVCSEAKLHLYASSLAVVENTSLRCHRLKSTTANAGTHNYVDTVKAGWALQPVASRPTWNTRIYSYQFTADTAWLTAGATNASEIDGAEYAELALTNADVAGYKTVTLPASWVNDWATHTTFSNGVLIKDSADTTGVNRNITVDAPTQSNSPVLEVLYSSVDANQFTRRKLTAGTYCYAVFSSHNRFIANPSTNQMAVAAWVDGSQRVSMAFIDQSGRIGRCLKESFTSGETVSANGAYGVCYDDSTGRYWFLAGNAAGWARQGVSAPYDPTSLVWTSGTASLYKGDFVVRNDMAHLVTMNSAYRLGYYTWPRGVDISAEITLHNSAFAGTQRTLTSPIAAEDIMTGDGTIYTSGALTDYPPFGALYIDTELFWYTGISGNNFTGVTRACYGSTAGAHIATSTVYCDHQALTYVAIADDATSMHVLYTVQSNSGATVPVNLLGSRFSYNWTNYIRHNFADVAAIWKNEANATVTLPLNQSTARRLDSGAKLPTYLSASIVHDGSVYVALQELKKPSGSATTANNEFMNNTDLDLKIAKLTAGVWTYLDPADMTSVCFVSSANGLAAVGLPLGVPTAKRYSLNPEGSWGPSNTLADYAGLPDAKGTYLWQSGSAGEENFDGTVLTYAMHQAYLGAIFLDATSFPNILGYYGAAPMVDLIYNGERITELLYIPTP